MSPNERSFDALVIGAGLAGVSAALHLHARQKNVAIINRRPGATTLSSGSWDLGTIPRNFDQGFNLLANSEQGKTIGLSLLCDSPQLKNSQRIEAAVEETAEYLQPHLPFVRQWNRPMRLPTASGGWKATFVASRLHASADLSRLQGRRVKWVYSKKWRSLGHELCRQWANGITPLEIDFPKTGLDWSLNHIAVRIANHRDTAMAFVQALRKALEADPADVVLFPNLFSSDSQLQELGQQLGVEVAEVLGTSEPLPGLRLERAMRAALQHHNIPLIEGNVLRAEKQNGRICSLSVQTHSGSAEYHASHYVLASGKFIGGGIQFGYRDLAESIFGLPVFVSRSQGELYRRNQIPWLEVGKGATHPWSQLGVWVDEKWRPIDSIGRPVFENLVACGSSIGGLDFAAAEVGLGFHAYTGWECANVIA